MQQKTFRELTPVLYGENLAKVLQFGKKEPGDVCFAAHYHERMELLHILHGNMQVTVDGNTFEAAPGDLVIICPNQPHSGIATQPGLLYDVIMFDLANLNNNSFAYRKYIEPILRQEIIFDTRTSHEDILSATDNLVMSYSAREEIHPLHTTGMIYSLLGTFYQHLNWSTHSTDPRTNVNAITAYIKEHFSEPLSTRSLSMIFGYNETYFSRMFKKATGHTVTQYITDHRLRHAQKLLTNSTDSIRAVAIKCGYTDVFYFSTRFKQYTGQSPREYRQSVHKK